MLLVPFESTPHPLPFSAMGKCGKKEPGRASIASLPPTVCQEVLFLAVAVPSAHAEARGVRLHMSATVADRTCSPGSCAEPPAPSLLSFLSELLSLSRHLGALPPHLNQPHPHRLRSQGQDTIRHTPNSQHRCGIRGTVPVLSQSGSPPVAGHMTSNLPEALFPEPRFPTC